MSKPFKFIPEESILRRPAFWSFAEDSICFITLLIVVANVWFWSIVFSR